MRIRPAVIYATIAILTLAPFGVSSLAFIVAALAGCELNEGSVSPCVIAGHDFGLMLYSMLGFGWLIFITIPSGVLLAMIVTGVLLIKKKRIRNEK